jgi:hypothetical protein
MWGIYGKALVIATPISIVTRLVNHAMGEPASWAVVLGCGTAMARRTRWAENASRGVPC